MLHVHRTQYVLLVIPALKLVYCRMELLLVQYVMLAQTLKYFTIRINSHVKYVLIIVINVPLQEVKEIALYAWKDFI